MVESYPLDIIHISIIGTKPLKSIFLESLRKTSTILNWNYKSSTSLDQSQISDVLVYIQIKYYRSPYQIHK